MTSQTRKASSSQSFQRVRQLFFGSDNPTRLKVMSLMNCLVLVVAFTVGIVMTLKLSKTVEDAKFGEFFRWFAIIFIPGVTFNNLLFGSRQRRDRQLGIPQAILVIVFVVYYYRFTHPLHYDNQFEYLNLLIVASVWVMITSVTCHNPMTFSWSHFWLSLGSSACFLGMMAMLVSGGIGTRFDRA